MSFFRSFRASATETVGKVEIMLRAVKNAGQYRIVEIEIDSEVACQRTSVVELRLILRYLEEA